MNNVIFNFLILGLFFVLLMSGQIQIKIFQYNIIMQLIIYWNNYKRAQRALERSPESEDF